MKKSKSKLKSGKKTSLLKLKLSTLQKAAVLVGLLLIFAFSSVYAYRQQNRPEGVLSGTTHSDQAASHNNPTETKPSDAQQTPAPTSSVAPKQQKNPSTSSTSSAQAKPTGNSSCPAKLNGIAATHNANLAHENQLHQEILAELNDTLQAGEYAGDDPYRLYSEDVANENARHQQALNDEYASHSSSLKNSGCFL